MKFFVCILILLLSSTKVYNQSVNFDTNDEWRTGHHPFPEMSRFLNSYSRIHHQPSEKTSTFRPTYSLLEYICSIANENKHIEEILTIFGGNYRSLIKQIIKHDCLTNKRDKRTTNHINIKKFSRKLFRNSHRQ